MAVAPSWTALPAGFRLPAGSEVLRTEKIIDRALLLLMIALTPGHLTTGGVPKAKTAKQREIERAELNVLLRLMTNDLGLTIGDGGYTESAMEYQLCLAGVQRGLITESSTGSRFRTTRSHGPWTLWDVMTEERKDRVDSRRQARLTRPGRH